MDKAVHTYGQNLRSASEAIPEGTALCECWRVKTFIQNGALPAGNPGVGAKVHTYELLGVYIRIYNARILLKRFNKTGALGGCPGQPPSEV